MRAFDRNAADSQTMRRAVFQQNGLAKSLRREAGQTIFARKLPVTL
jgi:hypothetical protein